MKKLIGTMICAATLFGAASLHAEGWEWRDGIFDRIHHAEERIDRGAERGRLDHHDARRLHDELDGIRDRAERMKDERHFDPRERENINRELDGLEHQIGDEERRY